MRTLLAIVITGLSFGAFAQDGGIADEIREAMASDARTEADVARDRNRKPVETLEFFQLEDDMRVLELVPGGGWYSKLLAPVLRDNGELYVSIFSNNVRDNLAKQEGFEHIQILDIGVETVRTEPYGQRDIGAFEFGVTGLDLAVTFRNMHNFTAGGRASMNAAVFAALRAGGLYGVIDHTVRHMEPMTRENRRRVDVVQIIKEVQAAGFELVDYSSLHYRPDDELRYEVGRASVTGNTDRFTLLFRKP
jgi:predicted methyltransferase